MFQSPKCLTFIATSPLTLWTRVRYQWSESRAFPKNNNGANGQVQPRLPLLLYHMDETRQETENAPSFLRSALHVLAMVTFIRVLLSVRTKPSSIGNLVEMVLPLAVKKEKVLIQRCPKLSQCSRAQTTKTWPVPDLGMNMDI